VGDLTGAVFAGFVGVLFGEYLGVLGVLGVVEEAADDEVSSLMLPKATMAALEGAADQAERLISAGKPGVVCGAMSLETMSKRPAAVRSAKRVVSKVCL